MASNQLQVRKPDVKILDALVHSLARGARHLVSWWTGAVETSGMTATIDLPEQPNGVDLKAWRGRNGYTQEQLRLLLDVSRQTIITWERSSKPLAKVVELALIALEHAPDKCPGRNGKAYTREEYGMMRSRPSEPDSRAARAGSR